MRTKLPKSLVFLLLLAVIVMLSWASLAQVKHEQQETIREKLKQQFPIVDSTEADPADPKERARRQKRSKRYNERLPKIGPQLVQSTEGYEWPSDFKPLPTSVSDAILVGTITGAKAHLSEDHNSVYSEFTFKIDDVLKIGTLPLRVGDCVMVERRGGRVRYPSGHISWLSVAGQGLPQLNGRYVFFLRNTDESDIFEILTGYQILQGRIRPLDDSSAVGFQRYSEMDKSGFMNQIREAIGSGEPR